MPEARTVTEQSPIQVFLVDDHEVVPRGLTGRTRCTAADGDGITVCRELRSQMPGPARLVSPDRPEC
jgi:two-component system, NarL family, response regulator DevR